MKNLITNDSIFDSIVDGVLSIDPVYYCEKYLTLDGWPFSLSGNGYKPFADIYRYIGIKALEPKAKPIVFVKGRQVGGTTMACALELYFMTCGLFGKNHRPPMRIMHCFPLLELGYMYTKTKLNTMIKSSKLVDTNVPGKKQSYIESKLDRSASSSDSMSFKQFENGNHLFIESTGLNADRIHGFTADGMFFDECVEGNQYIETNDGKIKIGKVYKLWKENKNLPLIKSFNETTEQFEYKKILKVWKKGKRELIQLTCGNRKIKCTPNHKFLTVSGWTQASDLKEGDLIKSSLSIQNYTRSLNSDQLQIVLGSFLGDGNISSFKRGRNRLRIIHGIAQKDYCEWKASMFDAKLKFIKKNGYSQKPAVAFATHSFGLPDNLPQKKTTCPQWILDKLDERGLAIWFMDDGSVNKNIGAVIYTCSFDEDSQKRIVRKLQSMGIDCKCVYYKHRNSGYYSIYFNKKGFQTLCTKISPFIHPNLAYKIIYKSDCILYKWNNKYNNYSFVVVDNIKYLKNQECVYDIEIEDNHNFIITTCRRSKNFGGPIAHNCQSIPGIALANATKILSQSKYGKVGNGVQLYFGTPRQKGSEFHRMWMMSSRQYYHLGCEHCKEYFPLYTPESNDWEEIWIEDDFHPDYVDPKTKLKPHGFIVKCIHCGFEQDKRPAAERGKWIATNEDTGCRFVGYQLNQLFMPNYDRAKIISEKPENHPVNTERAYQNEVLGEYFSGETSPITAEQIKEYCADMGRKFSKGIPLEANKRVYLGADWGQKVDAEQIMGDKAKRQQGQSYSAVVILSVEGPNLLSIEYAKLLKKNDPEYKKSLIDQLMRQYSVNVAVSDIGFSNDLSYILQQEHGEKFLTSRAMGGKMKNHIRYVDDIFPKEIQFERNHFIEQIFLMMKKGQIRFPFGDYEKIGTLIAQCASLEIKATTDRSGNINISYVKGSIPNDYLMALINAYIGYLYDSTGGFKEFHPDKMDTSPDRSEHPIALLGYIPGMNPMKRGRH